MMRWYNVALLLCLSYNVIMQCTILWNLCYNVVKAQCSNVAISHYLLWSVAMLLHQKKCYSSTKHTNILSSVRVCVWGSFSTRFPQDCKLWEPADIMLTMHMCLIIIFIIFLITHNKSTAECVHFPVHISTSNICEIESTCSESQEAKAKVVFSFYYPSANQIKPQNTHARTQSTIRYPEVIKGVILNPPRPLAPL